MADQNDGMTQDRAMTAEDMSGGSPEQGSGTETATATPAPAEQNSTGTSGDTAAPASESDTVPQPESASGTAVSSEPVPAPSDTVMSSSSESSNTSLGFDTADDFTLGQQNDWASGEEAGGTASSLTGSYALDGALGAQNDRAETEYADGSSTSSNVTTLSGEVSADALLSGMASNYASDEGGSSSESGSFLGQLGTGLGVTIQSANHGSESADGSSTYASDLSIDVDADVLGVLSNGFESSETDAQGSSSASSQDNSLSGTLDSDAMTQGQQFGESDYGSEDDAIVSIDLGGGPLLGVDLGGDSLLSLDTGSSHYDDAFAG